MKARHLITALLYDAAIVRGDPGAIRAGVEMCTAYPGETSG